MPRPAKTHEQKVVDRVGKRPRTATQIAQSMGYKNHLPIARALSDAESKGVIVRKDGKYQKSL